MSKLRSRLLRDSHRLRPEFFVPYGWNPVDVRSPLKTAARLKCLSFGMRLLSLLPQSNRRQGSRPG